MNTSGYITLLLVIAGILQIAGYARYAYSVYGSTIRPNKWSWLIWSFSTLLETLTYNGVTDDAYKIAVFYVSAFSCMAVTTLIWSKSEWKRPTFVEFLSVIASAIGLFIWWKYNAVVWAHYLLTIMLPIAFIPTYQDAWHDYQKEDVSAWRFWTISDILVITVILLRFEAFPEVPYGFMEAFCHGLVWAMIVVRRMQHHRRLRARSK